MGRRPRPIGTFGKINIRQIGPKKWEAYARYRDSDGKLKPMQRVGGTKSEAEDNLKKALSQVVNEIGSSTFDKNSRLKKIASAWLQELREDAASGQITANTLRNYTSWTNNWIVPNMGSLVFGNGEVSVAACEGLIKKVRRETSLDGAKSCRAILSAICTFAIKHKLIQHNPVRSAKRLKKTAEDHKEKLAMTLEQRTEMIEALRKYGEKKQFDSMGRSLGERGKVWRDLPDLAEAMLATGGRIGELICVYGDEVLPPEKKVSLTHHLERVTGEGLVRQPGRKGGLPPITKFVPEWSLPMWRRRKLASGGGLIFASWSGGLLDGNTLIHRLREALDACGFDWVTSHVWRKTYALILKEAGFTDAQIAHELGNSERVAREHYIPQTAGSKAAAEAMEGMFGSAQSAD